MDFFQDEFVLIIRGTVSGDLPIEGEDEVTINVLIKQCSKPPNTMILLWLFDCGVVVFKILCFPWKFVCVFFVGKIFSLLIQKCEKCNLRKSCNLRKTGSHNLRKIYYQFQNLKAFLSAVYLWSYPSSWNIHDEKNRSHALLFCLSALCVM